MKDKDPNDEELNKDEQDNINEADDSFGLPDLDFNPLDEESEEEEKAEEEAVEEVEEEVIIEEESEADEENSEEEEVAEVRSTYVPPKPESNAPKVIIALLVTIVDLLQSGHWWMWI